MHLRLIIFAITFLTCSDFSLCTYINNGSDSGTSSLVEESDHASPLESVPTFESQSNLKDSNSRFHVPKLKVTPRLFRKVRLELFKKQLLNKLKMESRPDPAVLSKSKLPIPIIRGEAISFRRRSGLNARMKLYNRKSQRIILLPVSTETSCKNLNIYPSGCIYFKFKNEISPVRIESAVLWVYKHPDSKDGSGNQMFIISELVNNEGNVSTARKKLIYESSYVKSGWMQIDVKEFLQKWLYKKDSRHGIDISCKTCRMNKYLSPIALDASYRPFLVVHTEKESYNHPRHLSRDKRSVKCSNDSKSCCLHPFEISVQELGWDDWIIYPEKFHANECRGSCDTSVWMPGVSVRVSALREFGYNPCCSVSKMASISVLYYNQNGTAVQSNEIKMVAEACDCT